MRTWHYTVGVKLRSILKDQVLRQATAHVHADERPVVWATTNPVWEQTANKMFGQEGLLVRLGKQETAAYGEGLYRVEVLPQAAPYGWGEFKRLSNIPEPVARSLGQAAHAQGSNPREGKYVRT